MHTVTVEVQPLSEAVEQATTVVGWVLQFVLQQSVMCLLQDGGMIGEGSVQGVAAVASEVVLQSSTLSCC